MDYVLDQMTVPDVKESTSPEFVREALAYGDWVLPADATVLRAEREIVRDRNYRIAVRTSPAGLAFMLRQSRFPYALDPCTPSCSLDREAVGQEAWFTSSSGRVMIREITVYGRDENTRIVHIEFRGV
ncbi:hypothetical protein [Nocardia sp. NPDC057353]|uniref:hypothetical protein n=1 Tax=Nocardia sp. NPDC057353 TaxID=3346104 RepID=UPI00362BD816